MNDFAGPFRLTSVRSTLSRGPVSGGFRVAPFVLLVSLLLPSLAKADDLAFIISPKAVAGVTASTKTFASFQNVTVSNSPNNVPRKFLVVASMSMIASNFTVGEFRLYAPGAINEFSPAVKLSVPYQTATSDPTNNGGLSFIFEYSGEGVKTLSVPDRATITNMGAELGVTTSVFPSDDITRAFMRADGIDI